MTPFPYSVELQAPIGEAHRIMLEHHVHHLAVTEHFELRGMVSDRDVKLLLSQELGAPKPAELTVADAYVDEYYAVELETPLRAALDNMAHIISMPRSSPPRAPRRHLHRHGCLWSIPGSS